MDRINPEVDALFEQALQDAGLEEADVHMVAVDAAHDPTTPGQMPVVYLPAGTPFNLKELPASPAEAEELRQSGADHRIGVCGRTESPELLGLLRWALDQAVQNEAAPDLWRFGWTIADGAVGQAHGGRPGSGVMHNVLPQVRDANLAAGRLVSKTFGPQLGKFYGPWGTLFRQQHDFRGMKTLPGRIVVLAAIYRSRVDQLTGSPTQTASIIAQADPAAGGWWSQLLADPTVQHVAGVIDFMSPSDQEIQEAGAPAEAWRPLAEFIDRAMQYGVDLLGL